MPQNDDLSLLSDSSDQPPLTEETDKSENNISLPQSSIDQEATDGKQCVIQVTGLPRGIPVDFVRSFFESFRSSGGGPTESIEMKTEMGIAFISYKDPLGKYFPIRCT